MYRKLNILIVTPEWPSEKYPYSGIFVQQEVEQLRKLGHEIKVFHFRGKKNPFRYLGYWFQCRKLIRQSDFDLVHVNWGYAWPVTIACNLPLVITFRGSDVQRSKHYGFSNYLYSFIMRKISLLAARFADKKIAVSEKIGNYIKADYVFPSGLSQVFKLLDKAEAREYLGIYNGQKVVLFPADPERKVKRFSLAKKAIKMLEKKHGIKTTMLTAKDFSREMMNLHFAASDVVLLTSAQEGSPNVVKEALSCNRPVVSVDVGDIKEQFAGTKGNLISEANEEALSAALAKVLSAQKDYDFRKQVMDKYDKLKLAKKTEAVYLELLG
jgi:teichuronic acid biosynthesis glycosyltransferase TuaC